MAISEKARKGDDADAKKEGGFVEALRIIFHALLLALVVRTLLFQPFNIPSGSMIPTLLIGDYLFVSKYSFGYSRHSMPFSPPLFEGRIWSAPPERGDVAVFKLPLDDSSDYIKRVIGLPGDRIQMVDGTLFINGEPVRREKVADFVTENGFGRRVPVEQYREFLPNGVSYVTLDINTRSYSDNTKEFLVPEGHYFMMGDNRDNSSDSRVAGSGVGFVPFENFVGKAQIIFFSIEGDARFWQVWKWPTSIRWDRLMHAVD